MNSKLTWVTPGEAAASKTVLLAVLSVAPPDGISTVVLGGGLFTLTVTGELLALTTPAEVATL